MTKTATDPLHVQFDAALLDTYQRAKRECRYNATYLLQLLTDLGGVATAKQLLRSENPAAGLTTLWATPDHGFAADYGPEPGSGRRANGGGNQQPQVDQLLSAQCGGRGRLAA